MDFAKPETVDLRYRRGKRCPTRNGGELYFETDGSGAPIVCLNNFFIVAPAWRNFTARLSERYTVVKYDLQNQGVSSQRGLDFEFSEYSEDLLDLIDLLEFDRVTLIGSSISTLIARDFAVRYPERIQSLVLVGPAFSPYGGMQLQIILRDWLHRLDKGGARSIFEYLYPLVFTNAEIERGGAVSYLGMREHFLALNSEAQVRACVTAAMRSSGDPKLLQQITSPTLLMVGDADYLWSASALEDGCALVPRAVGKIISRSGHMPMIDATDAFENAILEFLDQIDEGDQRLGASG
ncbi:alpha/beta fold hydrolase [Nocardia camponoti]|uniref:AB hydrolase-1 domain-containing protein n=1 Tax=Nocardia camponoti TaxID=1616106 RepID=A0A917VCQ7_9NOCA|nr:alpha/beta hydrolase [Nocardia camponoti]GGK63179.1 hypothetical protein GCM10011591_39320 [Nocardia camponoti]